MSAGSFVTVLLATNASNVTMNNAMIGFLIIG